jgi:hypothetical protein
MSSPLPRSKAETEQVGSSLYLTGVPCNRVVGGPLMTSRIEAFLVGLLLAGLAWALAI